MAALSARECYLQTLVSLFKTLLSGALRGKNNFQGNNHSEQRKEIKRSMIYIYVFIYFKSSPNLTSLLHGTPSICKKKQAAVMLTSLRHYPGDLVPALDAFWAVSRSEQVFIYSGWASQWCYLFLPWLLSQELLGAGSPSVPHRHCHISQPRSMPLFVLSGASRLRMGGCQHRVRGVGGNQGSPNLPRSSPTFLTHSLEGSELR